MSYSGEFQASTSGSVNKVGANDELIIDSAGNCGIGLAEADIDAQLHISSGTSGDCALMLQADTDNNNELDNPYIIFQQDGTLKESAIAQGNNTIGLYNGVSSNGGITFSTTTANGWHLATERMRIDAYGKVALQLSSSTIPSLVLKNGNTASTHNNGSQIKFGYGGSEDYAHHIQTRHQSGQNYNNAFDFYVCDGTQSNSITSGSKLAMSLDSKNAIIGDWTNGGAKIGLWGANALYMMVGHSNLDHSSANNYALIQGETGWTHINSASSASLKFRIANVDAMCIKSNRNVGVNNTDPQFKLHVSGSGGSYTAGLYAYHHSGGSWGYYSGTSWGTSPHAIGMRIDESMIVKGIYIMSDSRIKKDIVDIDDTEALDRLRLLKPKKYKYIDPSRGDTEVYGFIAQEVKAVIPESCKLVADFPPNMMVASYIAEKIKVDEQNSSCILTTQEPHNLLITDEIACRDADNQPKSNIEILEILTPNSIKVNTNFEGLDTKFIDEDGFVEENVIWIYGKKVDDFHNLNKDSIWTTACSALQEVDRQLQALKTKVDVLETANTDLMAEIAILHSVA